MSYYPHSDAIKSMCNVCLASNVRLRYIYDDKLLQVFEKLSNTKKIPANASMLCYICYSQLLRCHLFSDLVHQAQLYLTEQYMQPNAALPDLHFYKLTNTPIRSTSYDGSEDYSDKKENIEVLTDLHINIKCETIDDFKEEFEQIEAVQICYHKCEFCDDSYPTKSELVTHMKTHKIRQYKCNQCDRTFTKKGSLNNHLKQHIGTLDCVICNRKFATKKNLKKHLKSLHAEGDRLFCKLCPKTYKIKATFEAHMKKHIGEKPYSCETCGHGFKCKTHMERHKLVHKGEKPFSCTECPKRFRQKIQLIHHMRIHTGERPFSCDRCGLAYAMKSQLLTHIITLHTNEKPYACDICNKRFVLKSNLTRHRKSHSGERPFVCEQCGQTFPQKKTLINHMQKHTGQKSIDLDVLKSLHYARLNITST